MNKKELKLGSRVIHLGKEIGTVVIITEFSAFVFFDQVQRLMWTSFTDLELMDF